MCVCVYVCNSLSNDVFTNIELECSTIGFSKPDICELKKRMTSVRPTPLPLSACNVSLSEKEFGTLNPAARRFV